MIIDSHSEEIQFDVTSLGDHNVILSLSWLNRYNPTIDWKKHRVVSTSDECLAKSLQSPADTRGIAKEPLNKIGRIQASLPIKIAVISATAFELAEKTSVSSGTFYLNPEIVEGQNVNQGNHHGWDAQPGTIAAGQTNTSKIASEH